MKISIGCDHAGPLYKKVISEHLLKKGFEVENCGTDGPESVDYPDFAHKVASDVENGVSELGVLICGSANGVAMTANKHQAVRAGIAWKSEIAELARKHNDANVICIPARFVSEDEAIGIVNAFIEAEFEGGRHAIRVNKIICSLLAVILGTTSMFSQTQEKYAALIDSTQLYDHLSVFASDEFEGRETGTRGQRKAAAYLTNYYSSLGFHPTEQDVPLVNNQILKGSVTIDKKELKLIDDFVLFPGIQTHELLDIPMVFAGYGISQGTYNNYENINVEGKVVVVLGGTPPKLAGGEWDNNLNLKRDLASEMGAVGLVVLMKKENYKSFKGRMKFYLLRKTTHINNKKTGEGTVIPTFFLSEKKADKWLSKARGLKTPSKCRLLVVCPTGNLKTKWSHNIDKTHEEYNASNVLAFLPGSDPELQNELLIITSHYDHIGIIDGEINNGADDDGSGTVTVLEIAESFMEAFKNGDGPRRSVLFMNVVGEEKGLLGSEWYADNPVYPLEMTIANLNIDMIGRVDEAHEGTENYIYLIGADKLSTELHDISEKANKEHTNLELDYTFNAPDDPNRFYYRSDHYNFAKNGIPVIFYFSGVHEDYHAPGDDFEKILYGKTAKIGQLVFHTAWELLNRDERIVVDKENDFPADR